MSFVARCFPTEISKMGCYTNVVCCAVKILHSEQNPGPSEGSSAASPPPPPRGLRPTSTGGGGGDGCPVSYVCPQGP